MLSLKVDSPSDESWLKALSCLAPCIDVLDLQCANSALSKLSLEMEFPGVKKLRVSWVKGMQENRIDYGRLFLMMGRNIEELHLSCSKMPTDCITDLLRDVCEHISFHVPGQLADGLRKNVSKKLKNRILERLVEECAAADPAQDVFFLDAFAGNRSLHGGSTLQGMICGHQP